MDVSRMDVSKIDVVTDSSDEPMDGLDGRSHCTGYGFGEAEPFLDGLRPAEQRGYANAPVILVCLVECIHSIDNEV